jgi:hypothetical protein
MCDLEFQDWQYGNQSFLLAHFSQGATALEKATSFLPPYRFATQDTLVT